MKTIHPTAITEWFRKSELKVQSHFNQSMMLRCSKRLNPYTLKYTMRMLCSYHENLRAFWNGEQLVVREPNCLNLVKVEEYNLQKSTDVTSDILPIVQKLQSTIDLANGPLVHVGHFHLPEYDAVFLAIHHLVVDGVSWRIIVEDLNSIYPQLLTGACSVRLPKVRCTFAEYADEVHKYAESEVLAVELPYWRDVAEKIKCLKTEIPTASCETDFIRINVDKEVSRKMLTECVVKYGVEVNDLLLTALSRAWKNVTGQDSLAILLEGHGREEFGEHPLEIERIVGWFTTMFPVLLDGSGYNLTELVEKNAATLHAIPNKGFGYGTLLHIAHKEELQCTPQMTFNYLGSFEEGSGNSQMFSIENELPKGLDVSPLNISGGTPLSINCLVAEGCLVGSLSYDKGVLSKEKAEAFVKEFAFQLAGL